MTAVWRHPFGTSAPLSENPPVPIQANFTIPSGVWDCTFDKPLQPATLDFLNWTIRAGGNTWNPTAASSTGSIVSGTSTIGGVNPGADVIAFSPPPFDVLDLQDRPAPAFANFPLDIP